MSVFVRSHCPGSAKLIVDYWSAFKLRFYGYPLSIAFSRTSVFVAFLCGSNCHKNIGFVQKRCSVNGA